MINTTPTSPQERAPLTALAALAGATLGAVAWAFGNSALAQGCWAVTTLALLVPLTWSVARSLSHRDFGVDVLALLSMAGAMAVGQYLAGAIVAVMLAGGNALERFAVQRLAATSRCLSRASQPPRTCAEVATS